MQALVVLHVFSNTVWIGAIVSVGYLVGFGSRAAKDDARAKDIASLAVTLYQRVAVPAFLFSFLSGAARLVTDAPAYMRLHWMHGKLTAAFVVIALHHVIGARAKRAAAASSGSRQAGRSSVILTAATLVFAFVTVSFAILKGQLVP
jgi:putative membrane protein